ncbi:hypothetical protein M9458_043866, partial [Cirrhinus mrigala]
GKQKGRIKQISSTSFEISWNSVEGDQCSGIIWDSFSARCKPQDGVGNSQ